MSKYGEFWHFLGFTEFQHTFARTRRSGAGANLGMSGHPGGRGTAPASRLAEKMKMFWTHQLGSGKTMEDHNPSDQLPRPSHATFGW